MQLLFWYWQTFGVDLANPHFWVAAIALQSFIVPIGAVVGYKWGLTSPQAYLFIMASAIAGVAINLAF